MGRQHAKLLEGVCILFNGFTCGVSTCQRAPGPRPVTVSRRILKRDISLYPEPGHEATPGPACVYNDRRETHPDDVFPDDSSMGTSVLRRDLS